MDQKHTVLIDTGSSNSILSKSNAALWKLTVTEKSGTISSFHGNSAGYGLYHGKMPCTGIAANWTNWMVIDLKNISKENDIVAIIGIDFLRANKAVIDLNLMQIRIP
jgi:hypothetical protein